VGKASADHFGHHRRAERCEQQAVGDVARREDDAVDLGRAHEGEAVRREGAVRHVHAFDGPSGHRGGQPTCRTPRRQRIVLEVAVGRRAHRHPAVRARRQVAFVADHDALERRRDVAHEQRLGALRRECGRGRRQPGDRGRPRPGGDDDEVGGDRPRLRVEAADLAPLGGESRRARAHHAHAEGAAGRFERADEGGRVDGRLVGQVDAPGDVGPERGLELSRLGGREHAHLGAVLALPAVA
jgi:hypothetical protein